MSGFADALTKQVGPLPMGAWLLVGAGGLFIASRRDQDDELTREVQQVPVPVGAIASPDGAPTVINLVVYTPKGEPGAVDEVTPAPTVPSPVPVPVAPAPTVTPPPTVRPPVPSPAGPPAGMSWGEFGASLLPPGSTVPKSVVPSLTPKPATQRSYTVVRGDTLSSIGARFGVDWRRIYSANASTIERAARAHGKVSSSGGHWIYPGTRLVIP